MERIRTKIVCTIGPASREPAKLEALIEAGMSVARLNFSHGTQEDHGKTYRAVRAVAKKLHEPIMVFADLQGPKIRLGDLPESGVEIKEGETIAFSTAIEEFKGGAIPVTYKGLHQDVKAGDRLLIEDGIYEAIITSVKGKEIRAKVVNGGRLYSHKGMNFPDSTLRVSALTAKDKSDAVFAIGLGVDWIAFSFVISPDDVRDLRRIIKRETPRGRLPARIIVKVEKHEAVDRFAEILDETDGVMVARGDLGVEIPAEDVPIRQKAMVELCRLAGKPVIVATQMLDSMIRNPRPTRAEVSDVANAVFDHTDATMLSGETATGKYPVESVAMMARIINEAEKSVYDDTPVPSEPHESVAINVARTLRLLAADRHIDAVLGFLEFAPWADHLHLFHPEVPLFLAVSSEEEACQQNLRWGVRPFALETTTPKSSLRRAIAVLKHRGLIKSGQRLAVVLGAEHGEGFDLVEVE